MTPASAWTWLFGSRRADLRTALSAEQCFETLIGKHEVAGWVRPGHAWVRKRSFVRNSFRPVLRLTWEADGSRTTVVCRCGVSPWVVGFTLVWLGVLVIVSTVVAVFVVAAGLPPASLAAFPVLMLFV